MNILQAILTKSLELKQLISDELDAVDNIETLEEEVSEETLLTIDTMDDVYMALLKMNIEVAGLINKDKS